MRRATAAPLRICTYSMPVLCLKICGVKLSGGITFSTVACAGASENAPAGTLPKNIWPQDLARQGGAIAFFLICSPEVCENAPENGLKK